MGHYVKYEKPSQMRGEKILKAVLNYFEITEQELTGPCRLVELAQARHIAAYLLREDGFSFADCGKLLNKNYTTIMNSNRRVRQGWSRYGSSIRQILKDMEGAA